MQRIVQQLKEIIYKWDWRFKNCRKILKKVHFKRRIKPENYKHIKFQLKENISIEVYQYLRLIKENVTQQLSNNNFVL